MFLATAQEVATRAIVDTLRTRGCVVLVPLVIDRTTMHAVPFPGWEDLAPGALGIPAPPPAPAWAGVVDVVLVPGLAFTPDGARLGYGGGYYDRWLAAHQPAQRVALAFERQLTATLPHAAHDQPLDRIFTEVRTIDCRASPDAS